MATVKRLSGVAHDISHHAQSGLAYLYPHLWEACQIAGIVSVTAGLKAGEPYPASLPEHGPLRAALDKLRLRFGQILQSRGLDETILSEARLDFTFPVRFGYGSIFGVHCTLVARGQRYEWDFPAPDELTLARMQRNSAPIGAHGARGDDL